MSPDTYAGLMSLLGAVVGAALVMLAVLLTAWLTSE